MIYFGTRLSENISRREPEGYLICLNVPVARTGAQEYLPSELGLPGPDDRLIPVLRPEEEVFSPACLASFEGMPVTDGHPASPEGVTAENIRSLQKGHAHNIRRGAGPDSDLLLADLIVTDPVLSREILSGKREISCGYNYTLCGEDGNYVQREIRGNHVAVVDAGRAGPRVSIRDRKALNPNDRTTERSNPMKKKSLWRAKLMTRMARDGDVDGLAEIITELLEEPEAPAAAAAVLPETAPVSADPVVSAVVNAVAENLDPTPAEEAPVTAETPEDRPAIMDCGPEILEALRQIVSLLSGFSESETRDEAPGSEAETAAETAEVLAESAGAAAEAAEAAAEAVEEAAAAAQEEPAVAGDPVEILVAEILEADEDAEECADAGEEIISSILEPEKEDEEEDPRENALAADALRAALASFRPQLKKMSPAERQRFSADVAARMKKLSRKSSADGKPGAYAALRAPVSREQSSRSLGQKIMETRNVNLRK